MEERERSRICQICGSDSWLDLPDPAEGRSVTTAGRIISEGLAKAQCGHCGFVQRTRAQFLGLTDYYEEDYAKYYDRPGTGPFHAARYRVLAEWMIAVLDSLSPSTILDVGCGQGWGMEAMKGFYPQAQIQGLEPSRHNSEVAREKGFRVYEGRVGDTEMPPVQYDLIYSNNVIQHVTDAREFLASLKEMAGENGVIVITCPDGSIPNIEILWADQNFSFLPGHLLALCEDVGLPAMKWFRSPFSPSVPPAQLLLFDNRRSREAFVGMDVPAADLKEVYRARCRYLRSFAQIDDYFCSRIKDSERVFNFGASYWSSILAAYCPRYWQQVSACLVDQTGNGGLEFLDKAVLEMGSIEPRQTDSLVLGTSPMTHEALRPTLSPSWSQVVSWDQFAVQS